jgi:hypothetical protein
MVNGSEFVHQIMADAERSEINDFAVKYTHSLGNPFDSKVIYNAKNGFDFDNANEVEERYAERMRRESGMVGKHAAFADRHVESG